MRGESGITLTVLIITVIVLAIVVTIGATSSIEVIDTTKQNKFISELKIVQSKVDIANQEMEIGSIAYDDIGKKIEYLSPDTTNKINMAFEAEGISETEKANFRYFNKEELEKLGVVNLTQEVLINFKTKKVISVDGLQVGDNTYYSRESINAQ